MTQACHRPEFHDYFDASFSVRLMGICMLERYENCMKLEYLKNDKVLEHDRDAPRSVDRHIISDRRTMKHRLEERERERWLPGVTRKQYSSR